MNKNIEFLKKLIACQSFDGNDKEKNKVKSIITSFLESIYFKISYLGKDKNVIYAKRIISADFKTLLIYGHYDVQPASYMGWNTRPFSMVKKGKRIYGRGTADNKGQLFANLIGTKILSEQQNLGINLIFLIEGEEEIGSPTLKKAISSIKDKVDYILISDSEMEMNRRPIICSSLRGNVSFEINVITGHEEAHSGIYGGVLPNAANEIFTLHEKVFGKITNHTRGIQIDKSNEPFRSIDSSFSRLIKSLSITKYSELNPTQLAGLSSSLQISGVSSGFTGQGVKNIIPNIAIIKYNYRIAPSEDGMDVWAKTKSAIVKNANLKKYKLTIRLFRISNPVQLDTNSEIYRLASSVSKKIYGKSPINKPEGGSISIVSLMQKYVTDKILLFGYANPDCNMHGPNENIEIMNLEKGIEFSCELIKRLGESGVNH